MDEGFGGMGKFAFEKNGSVQEQSTERHLNTQEFEAKVHRPDTIHAAEAIIQAKKDAIRHQYRLKQVSIVEALLQRVHGIENLTEQDCIDTVDNEHFFDATIIYTTAELLSGKKIEKN